MLITASKLIILIFQESITNILAVLVPCMILYLMGASYAKKTRDKAVLFPVLFRSLAWSLILAWSFYIGGHAAIPLPSWYLLFLWLSGHADIGLFSLINSSRFREYMLPHPLLTPSLPVLSYLLGYYRLHKK